MGTITGLSIQQRNSSRVNVFIDGTFAFGLALDIAAALRTGQTLSPDDIAALQQRDQIAQAKERAVRLLARRPYSSTEIERNLRKNGFSVEVIDAVRQYLAETELVDDSAFASFWVEQRETFRPRSRMALRQELQLKGIDRETISEALSTVDETDSARRLATRQARRWNQLDEETFRTKLSGYLLRQGFGYGIVREVVRETWLATQTENDE